MFTALAKARDGALNKLADVLGEGSEEDEDAGTVTDGSTGDAWLADTDDDVDARPQEAPSPASELLAAAARVPGGPWAPVTTEHSSEHRARPHAGNGVASAHAPAATAVLQTNAQPSTGATPVAAARALNALFSDAASAAPAEAPPVAGASKPLERAVSSAGLVDVPLSPALALPSRHGDAEQSHQLRVKLATALEDTQRLREALSQAQHERDAALQAREADRAAALAARSQQAAVPPAAMPAAAPPDVLAALQRRVDAAEAAAAAAQSAAAAREAAADAARGAAEDAAAAAAEARDSAVRRAEALAAEASKTAKELTRLRAHVLEMGDADASAAEEVRVRTAAEMDSLRSEVAALKQRLEERNLEAHNLQTALGALSADVDAQHRRMAEASQLAERLGVAAAEVAAARAQAAEAQRQAEAHHAAAVAAERNAAQRSDEATSLAAEATRLRGMLEHALRRLAALSAAQAASCDKHAVAALLLAYVAHPCEEHAQQLAVTLGMDAEQRAAMGLDGAPPPAAATGKAGPRNGLGRLLQRVTVGGHRKEGPGGAASENDQASSNGGSSSLADAWIDFLRAQSLTASDDALGRPPGGDEPSSPALDREARIQQARLSVASQDAPPPVRAEPPASLAALIGNGPRVLL